jgi:DNA-binding NarL/FixJ family response regulator
MAPVEIFGKRLINMGVSGFLSKQENETEVVKALQLILQRRQYLSPAMQELLNQKKQPSNNPNNPFDDLSEREISVANYLLKGYRVKEISNMLDIKLSTVATYKARIFEKLGVTNKMDMKRLAEIYHFGDDLM